MSGVRSRARRADVVRSDRGRTPVQSPQDSGRAQKRGHRPGHDDRAKVVATHVTREVGPPPFQLSPCQKIRISLFDEGRSVRVTSFPTF